ncbi:hypothetical protein BGZ95_007767 [Linnemannia exigua]|uniref:Uncharacterized protein n=1 Tax=Linnemannia exigua TaxID=604196 RepID=A0AAD4DER2_9FUNG|nr:hypothetical protein BGZ95_007767 [Linnemannia exigua]
MTGRMTLWKSTLPHPQFYSGHRASENGVILLEALMTKCRLKPHQWIGEVFDADNYFSSEGLMIVVVKVHVN